MISNLESAERPSKFAEAILQNEANFSLMDQCPEADRDPREHARWGCAEFIGTEPLDRGDLEIWRLQPAHCALGFRKKCPAPRTLDRTPELSSPRACPAEAAS